jgi:hypothetical protein
MAQLAGSEATLRDLLKLAAGAAGGAGAPWITRKVEAKPVAITCAHEGAYATFGAGASIH